MALQALGIFLLTDPLLLCRLCDTGKAKYELVTSLRTHLGSQDDAFNCMEFAEDADGFHGILMQKHVVEVAGRALKTNIAALAPRVLPYTELVSAFGAPIIFLLIILHHS